MKSKKLSLKSIKVKSFVTDLENGRSQTVQGGKGVTFFPCGGTKNSCLLSFPPCDVTGETEATCDEPTNIGGDAATICKCF